jgi:hypothetical protein
MENDVNRAHPSEQFPVSLMEIRIEQPSHIDNHTLNFSFWESILFGLKYHNFKHRGPRPCMKEIHNITDESSHIIHKSFKLLCHEIKKGKVLGTFPHCV